MDLVVINLSHEALDELVLEVPVVLVKNTVKSNFLFKRIIKLVPNYKIRSID